MRVGLGRVRERHGCLTGVLWFVNLGLRSKLRAGCDRNVWSAGLSEQVEYVARVRKYLGKAFEGFLYEMWHPSLYSGSIYRNVAVRHHSLPIRLPKMV